MRTPAPNWWRICSPPNQGDPRKKGRDDYFQLCSSFFSRLFSIPIKRTQARKKRWLFPTLFTTQSRRPKEEWERRLFPTLLKIIFAIISNIGHQPIKGTQARKGEAIISNFAQDYFSYVFSNFAHHPIKETQARKERRLFSTLLKIFHSVKPLLQINSHSGMRVLFCM